MTIHSPAQILTELLITLGLFDDPDDSSFTFPVFTTVMPDDAFLPGSVATVYNTPGLKDGRLMSGVIIFHHGVQLAVRIADPEAGWLKCNLVEQAMQAVTESTTVTIGATTYTLNNVSQQGPILALGLEGGTVRRHLFTLNFLMTITG